MTSLPIGQVQGSRKLQKHNQHAAGPLGGLRTAFYCGVGLAALGLAMPAQAVDGVTVIQVITTSDMNSTYDNDPIHATGAGAFGVYYDGTGGDPDFTINYTGDILSDEESAVYIHTAGEVTLIGDGDFKSEDGVIYVDAGGDASVTHTGRIDGILEQGIYVTSGAAAEVDVTGDVRSTEDGITANSYSVDKTAKVTIDGSVQSDKARGIVARSGGDVTVTLEDGASVASMYEGIYADNFKSTVDYVDYTGDVTVQGKGTVTSWKSTGIYANASADVTVDLDAGSRVEAQLDAINANSYGGDVTVDVTGTFISYKNSGILANAPGDVKVTVGAGSSIQAETYGINANSYDGNVTVDAAGTITAYQNNAIKAHAKGDIDVDYTGTAISKQSVIDANAYGSAGDIDVYAAGSLTSWEASGIAAFASGGGVKVENHAYMQVQDDGINAKSTSNSAGGTVEVDNYGTIHADTGQGIYAESSYKTADVYNEGDIYAKTYGIYANALGSSSSNAKVENHGDISTTVNQGIYARSNAGYVLVSNYGDITAQQDGIYAITYGDDVDDTLTVTSSGGTITSRDNAGVYAKAAHQAVSVTVNGNIYSKQAGIYARSEGSNDTSTVYVDWTGTQLTSLSGNGIDASSTDSSVTVKTNGAITADSDGIHVVANLNTLDSRINITSQGSITALKGYGIYATGTEGGITIVNTANITGDDGGIYAFATGDRDGATAIVDNTGNIQSYWAAGIYAKSSSEDVTVTQRTGTISGVLGAQYGIQAVADTKTVTVNVEAGGVIEKANTAGVLMRAFDGSFLNNYGTITGGPGLAVQTTGYNGSTINNYGTISGSVEFNGGMSVFNNNVGGVYNIASLTNFTGGTFNNSGILSPGGSGMVTDTAYLQANLKQSADGVFLVDVDGTDADYLQVDGNAELAGKLQLNFLDVLQPTSVTVMSTYWLDQRELTLANLIVDGEIRYVDDTDVVVDINGYDYSPMGLNKNGTTVGDALTDAYDHGNHEVDPILTALANLTTIEDYQNALEQLTPEVYADNNLSVVQLSNLFTGRLFSCRVADGAYRFSAEGECQWFAAAGSTTEQTATSEYQGYSQKAVNIAGGGQWALSEDWRVGAGLGYTSSSSETDVGATSESTQFQGGAVVKYDHEGMMLAGAVSVGTSSMDTERTVSFGGLDETLTGTSNSTFVSARLQGSYTYQLGDAAYVKPLVDVDLTNLHFGGLQETGGSSALTLSEGNYLVATFAPAVEVGGEMALSDGLLARPYVRVGGSISNSDGMHVVADFAGETTGFEVAGGGDTVLAKLGAGVDILATNDISVRAYYEGAFGETTRQNTVGFKFGGQF